MAEVVLGLATSHGPMLSTAPERWGDRIAFDRGLPALSFAGGAYQFDKLVEMRQGEKLSEQLTLETMRDRSAACKAAVTRLSESFAAAQIDKVVLIGNDQMEVFTAENLPAFLVCRAENIHNIPFTDEQKRRLGPGIIEAEHGHHGPAHEIYPGLPELGEFIIRKLIELDFDVATSNDLPAPPSSRSSGAPHAYGFVYRQIFGGRPVPHLPVFVNTFYPPNQPSIKRCVAFGRALATALHAWDDDSRIAVIGSGGLSHFVIDEDLDRRFIDAVARGDMAAVDQIPEALMRDGTSELKNWIITAAMLAELGLSLDHCDYIPCYRSLAGTGNAMGFAEWR